MRRVVAVIGNSNITGDSAAYKFAYELGILLAREEFVIVCGGLGGIMEAVAQGAKSVSPKACVICIIPQSDKQYANRFCEIVIPTGMGIMRNFLVVNSADVVIAIAGGSGTLSEMAFAWQLGKPILAVTKFQGWAQKLAGKSIDSRFDKSIIPVDTVTQIKQQLEKIFLG